jgi:P27 family predicted phage terminase small subunit
MGLRGPAPKPTALRVLEGNPSKRPLNAAEPKPDRVAPRCPRHLDKEARREWNRIVPILLRMGVLTEADEYALANLCQAYSTLIKAQQKLSEVGLLLKTPSGYVQQNPLLSIVNSCTETITKLSREFGLTPASRTRLQATPEAKADSTESRMTRWLHERKARAAGEE